LIVSTLVGTAVPIPTEFVVVSVEVVMVEVAFKVLTFSVEYAATPGTPLLILETVRVDNVIFRALIVEPVNVE